MAISDNHSKDKKSKSYRKPRGRDFWINHINTWLQCDLTQADYCRQNNISKTAFYGWKCKLKAEEQEAQDNAFVAVQIKPPQENTIQNSDTLAITLANGIKVGLPVQANPSQLLPWLETLSHLP